MLSKITDPKPAKETLATQACLGFVLLMGLGGHFDIYFFFSWSSAGVLALSFILPLLLASLDSDLDSYSDSCSDAETTIVFY